MKMIESDYCVKLYKSTLTATNFYLIQEYCNGEDLSVLCKQRPKLSQMEVSQIMRKIVAGCAEFWK